MAVSKVILNGNTLIDTTDKTVTSGGMLSGVTALKNDGTSITGSISTKTSSDLTASGATVTAPAGYYASSASKSVSSGSATTPSTTITANPSISVSSGGLITASVSASKSVTPTVSAGYVSSGTAGTVSVSGSNTSQLTTQAAQTIHPSTSDQTIASGKYLTGAQTIKGVLLTNLSADNIKKDVVVKVGDSTDDDCVTSVTGTYEGGGSSTTATKKQINFIDYDGTLLYSYAKAEINAMTSESELPANPSHTGLTAQGWNWTLAQIKAQLTAASDGDVWVGQMYATESGDTEIDIQLQAPRLSPYLGIAVNGTVEVDWGDGTAKSTITGTSLTTQIRTLHTYANEEPRTISIHKVSGSYTLYGSSTYCILSGNFSKANNNRVYANSVKNVRIGNNGITSIGSYAFYNCYSLTSVTIPNSVTSIGNSAFSYCYSLTSVTIPNGITSISDSAFSYCYSLTSVTIPNGITSISNNAFYYCYSLTLVTIPNGITSISNNTFYYCYSLTSVTIPNSVTSIGSSVFYNCAGLGSIHFKSSTPPAVSSSSAWTNVPTDCIIYVPSGKLSDYTGASNYPSSSTYTYVEE